MHKAMTSTKSASRKFCGSCDGKCALAFALILTSTFFFIRWGSDVAVKTFEKNIKHLQNYVRFSAHTRYYCPHIFTAGNENITTSLSDVTITVKSSKKFHDKRVKLQLQTWMKNVVEQTYVITDSSDEDLERELPDGHLLSTNCGSSHSVAHLCCKTSHEFDQFIKKNTNWWCHFDDDVYVNIEALIHLLNNYNPLKDYIYVGRPSVPDGFKILFRRQLVVAKFNTGAGYCVSRALAHFMDYWVANGSLVSTCHKSGLADDATVGMIITNVLSVPLVESFEFHSPFDANNNPPHKKKRFEEQITYMDGVEWPGTEKQKFLFSKSEDPTGFLSVHCALNPQDKICSKTAIT